MMLVLLTAVCCLVLSPVAAQTDTMCAEYHCENEGTCTPMCECAAGYEGPWCENVTDWHNLTCSDNSCTPVENSTCFNGTCLCAPGYFYSISTKQCADHCCQTDLQPTYSTYVDWGINGHNKKTLLHQTLASCQQACTADDLCLSAEIKLSTGVCNIQYVTALQAEDDWAYDKGWVFFQKDCA